MRNFATRGAFLSLFVVPVPSPPPSLSSHPFSARSPSLFASRGCVFCRVYNRLYATASRPYRVIVAGFYPRRYHIRDRLEKLRHRGVRRKAPKLRRKGRKRRRRWRWLDIVKRAREGDQQRIRLTGDGRPQQNVSMFFSLFYPFAFFAMRCERRNVAEKRRANTCDLN